MIPHDLPATELKLPPGDRGSAILVSGPALRDLRLGYQLQKRYPGLLKRWWLYEAPRPTPSPWDLPSQGGAGRRSRYSPAALARGLGMLLRGDFSDFFERAWERMRLVRRGPKRPAKVLDFDQIERHMFRDEIDRLRCDAPVEPVHTDDLESEDVLAEIAAIDPYFLVSLCGPLSKKRLLDRVRGLVISQHPGWSPEFTGEMATETALYHRQTHRVGSTVHLVSCGSDSGPILRRSLAALHPDDSPEHCYLAVVALGTNMVLEVLAEAMLSETLVVFEPPYEGENLGWADLGAAERRALHRDFSAGWLAEALRMEQDW